MEHHPLILSAKDVNIQFDLRGKVLHAIRGIDLDLYQGEVLAIVGESGSGKSVFTKSFMGLLDANGSITGGTIDYYGMADGKPLRLSDLRTEKDWLRVRGREIAMVMQDPMTSLRQRVVIAIAAACSPKILICDEPTTALDVTIQAQILQLLKKMQVKYDLTILLITHDLGVVANIADRVAVMYAGDIVEIGTADEIYYDPRHPYTWALLSSMPQMGVKGEDLFNIVGTPPNLFAEIRGDAFAPRNPQALKIDFVRRPPYFTVSPTHKAKTWLLDPRAPKIEPPAAVKMLREEGL